ncbi:serine/threonine-protein kinase DCLK3-like [Carassius auratus]|uniref:Serine/threonine-protein kinase DCLK3-like n=1 Tax=Carassius auratus TaxID=7957 RepID=A0A6P6LSL6_CARAU|nr:serine/threonine-protein kinase DCLK3-like [Carassius auratus]
MSYFLCWVGFLYSVVHNQEELFRLIQNGEDHFLSPYWDNVSEGAKALVRALLEVNRKRRLTAGPTLQHDWLQHATAQKDHKGAIKATDSMPERRNQQKLSGVDRWKVVRIRVILRNQRCRQRNIMQQKL